MDGIGDEEFKLTIVTPDEVCLIWLLLLQDWRMTSVTLSVNMAGYKIHSLVASLINTDCLKREKIFNFNWFFQTTDKEEVKFEN